MIRRWIHFPNWINFPILKITLQNIPKVRVPGLHLLMLLIIGHFLTIVDDITFFLKSSNSEMRKKLRQHSIRSFFSFNKKNRKKIADENSDYSKRRLYEIFISKNCQLRGKLNHKESMFLVYSF